MASSRAFRERLRQPDGREARATSQRLIAPGNDNRPRYVAPLRILAAGAAAAALFAWVVSVIGH